LETLGDGFFFSPGTFLGVAKLHVFWRKKIGYSWICLSRCHSSFIFKLIYLSYHDALSKNAKSFQHDITKNSKLVDMN
jgi:hypothetical protein